MIDLNSREAIKQLDKSGVLDSIEQLPDQIEDAWNQTASKNYSQYGQGVNQIVVAGMGGSTLGAEVIRSLAKSHLKVPLEIVKDYTLPGYVNQNTLVILSSYSGTTEETLSASLDAQTRHAKLAVITSGGDLASLAASLDCPAYIIDPKFNPSNQPRMAIGYAVAGQIGLLKSLGLIEADSFNVSETIAFLKAQNQALGPEAGDNLPKKLAHLGQDKIIYLVSGEHLTGATHVFNNQLNENAKHLTVELVLPELNHHYMEGLPHPDIARQAAVFWFIDSSLYSDKLKLRVNLTQDVVTQNHFASEKIPVNSKTPFSQVFELIQLGAYTNFYLAMIHGLNPAPIPWVDYFKSKLKLHNS